MIVTIQQPEHLPWLGFFHKMAHSDVFVLLDNVQYEKNNYQNRNRIRAGSSEDGWSWVTVPVLSKGSSQQKIRDVQINNGDRRWRERIGRSLEHNYSRAPYFKRYAELLGEAYGGEAHGNPDREALVDLNLNLIDILAAELGVGRPMICASELNVSGSRSELLLSICRELGATEYLSGPGGRNYLDESIFHNAGIAVGYHEFHHPEYKQVYEPFVSNMSLIDLLFTHGSDSAGILFGPEGPPNRDGNLPVRYSTS